MWPLPQAHKIVVYSDAGKFLFTLNSRGRAANEYLEIKSFCVTDHEIGIIDNGNHLFKIYDAETGRFLMNKKMPFVAWDVEGLDRGGYVKRWTFGVTALVLLGENYRR